MKAFICSMPRSGTYLMAKLLTLWGMTNTNYHFSEGFVEHRTQENIDRQRLDINEVNSNTQDFWHSIGHNQFAVGHLAPECHNLEQLKSFKRIVLIRDHTEIDNSLRSWSQLTGYDIKLLDSHKIIPDWRWVPDTFVCEFNRDLIGINIGKLDDLQRYLFGKVTHCSDATMQLAQASMTFTKSSSRP